MKLFTTALINALISQIKGKQSYCLHWYCCIIAVLVLILHTWLFIQMLYGNVFSYETQGI